MIAKVDAFLDKNSDILNQLLERVKAGDDLSDLTFAEVQKKKKVRFFSLSLLLWSVYFLDTIIQGGENSWVS